MVVCLWKYVTFKKYLESIKKEIFVSYKVLI
jgi:hypothetical protein